MELEFSVNKTGISIYVLSRSMLMLLLEDILCFMISYNIYYSILDIKFII